MRLPWLKLVGLLLVIWLIAGGVIFLARSAKTTPESLMAYVERHPLAGVAPADRAKIIEKVAKQLNQLGYEDRQQFRMGRKMNGFGQALTPEERDRFLDLTLPAGFKQMMEALNNMTQEKRQQFVSKALEDMKKHEGDQPPDAQIDDTAKKIIDQGFKSFYSDANAQVKMDVAPLIEQLQKNLQGGR